MRHVARQARDACECTNKQRPCLEARAGAVVRREVAAEGRRVAQGLVRRGRVHLQAQAVPKALLAAGLHLAPRCQVLLDAAPAPRGRRALHALLQRALYVESPGAPVAESALISRPSPVVHQQAARRDVARVPGRKPLQTIPAARWTSSCCPCRAARSSMAPAGGALAGRRRYAAGERGLTARICSSGVSSAYRCPARSRRSARSASCGK